MHTTTMNPSAAAFAGQSPGLWQRVWNALEAHGQRRAAAELRRIAMLHASTDPALSARLRALASQPADR